MSAKLRPDCLKASTIALFLLFFQAATGQGKFEEVSGIAEQQAKTLKQEVVVVVATKDTSVYTKDTKTFSAIRGQAPLGFSSQWLTAALVLIMVDEGKISLDDKVSQYLPVYGSYMKSYVTIRHCLSHFTGIQTETNKVVKLFEKKKFASLEEAVAGYAKKEIQENAGEAFRFSGMGPDIAGRILELVTKKKFDMLIQQKLLRPLGMRQTTFSTLDASAISPSSGGRSTAADYTKFLRMLLNGGMHNGQRILSEAAVKTMRQVLTEPGNRKYSPAMAGNWEYALGAWAAGDETEKLATVLTAPSLGGTTALVDFCRGYAFVYLQKELEEETKFPAGAQFRDALEQLYPARCR